MEAWSCLSYLVLSEHLRRTFVFGGVLHDDPQQSYLVRAHFTCFLISERLSSSLYELVSSARPRFPEDKYNP